MLISKTAELSGETLTHFLDMGGTCHREPEATLGTHGKPVFFVFRQRAVVVTLLVREWGKHEAIRHRLAVEETHFMKKT